MKEYHKIETVNKRDMEGTKKLVEDIYRNKTVEYLKNCNWLCTEKIHGMNIRVIWDGHKVSYAGRTDKAELPGDLVEYLDKHFKTNEAEEMFEQLYGDTSVTIYGEGYGKGIQKEGATYKDCKEFIIFDVLINSSWCSYETVQEHSKAFGVDVVPSHGVMTLTEAINYIKGDSKSLMNDTAFFEGIVAKPVVEITDCYNQRVIVKIKKEDYKC